MASIPIIKTDQSLCDAIRDISKAWEESEQGVMIEIKPIGKRSISQNSTAHMWWGQAGEYFLDNMSELIWDGVKFSDMKTRAERLEAVKEMQKVQFLGYFERNMHNAVTGESIKTYELKRTRDLPAGEMFNFMRQCEEQLLGWGVKLITPINSQYRELIERQNE